MARTLEALKLLMALPCDCDGKDELRPYCTHCVAKEAYIDLLKKQKAQEDSIRRAGDRSTDEETGADRFTIS